VTRVEQQPRLAEGVELIGEYADSGFEKPPYIARRADGQIVQMPELLFRLAEQLDGRRDHGEIARRLTELSGRGVQEDHIRELLDKQLRPLGVAASANGTTPPLRKIDPLLGLKFRATVVPERVTNALTSAFRPLFLPPIVVAVIAGLAAVDAWLLVGHGVAQSLRQVIYNPALLLVIVGGVVAATALHEIGHATACRYSGARPGAMGVGIYVVWPAFYTAVTDAYRLGKAGRLRTDLGGVYFNAVFALAVMAAYAATRFEPLLLLVVLQNFAILQQLLPLLRFDGHYVISDLTGVPDMLSRVKPVLLSLIPGRPPDRRVSELKPWVRVAVSAYVLTIVPVIVLSLVLLVVHAPRAFSTAWDSLGLHYDRVGDAFGAGKTLSGVAGVLQMGALVLPLAGMTATGGRLGTRTGTAAWRWSAGDPARRGTLVAATGTLVALAAYTWWPNGEYRPIQPGERGTLAGALPSIAQVPDGRPSLPARRARELRGAPSERERRRLGAPEVRPSYVPRKSDSSSTPPDPFAPPYPAAPDQTPSPGAAPAPGAQPPAGAGDPAPAPTPAAPAPPATTTAPSPTPAPPPTSTTPTTSTAPTTSTTLTTPSTP
jgi:putative peptide zinc metalloprotease protein